MYDFKTIENEIAEFWKKQEVYSKVKKKNEGGIPFYFCDGPPYATGQIHPGTAWNKTIKDAVCRYWRMKGRNVRAQPGFDTHGLPIELKVEQELGIKNKNEIEKMGIEHFIKKCKDFATKYIGIMSNQFQSVGVWMDFENPYITYKDEFIEKSWSTLKMAWEKGLMHEGIYVLPYCYRCETTMANYELEYGEETDPSIYVKFKLRERTNEYLVIWTTTPWTVVADMMVMVHPDLVYAKVQVDEEVWIIGKERVEHVLEISGKSGTILEEFEGKKLDGLIYDLPIQDKIKKVFDRRVVLSSEYVGMEEGTGLVHGAPGTGPEDFIVGKKYGIEAFCPVDEHGRYTEQAGDYKGLNVREANIDIIKELKIRGYLVKDKRIKHRYPHCWRCKTPLIFVTTNQWFITVSKTKEKMLAEVDNVKWHPAFVRDRFHEFVNGAPDWCVSRQRYWGIPLPIWKCKKCKSIKVVGSRNELPHKEKIPELHRPYVDAVLIECNCGGSMHRIPDVLDVWFDSGNAIWASLSDEDSKTFSERADVIIEGQDQIRGWFYSLLGSGIVKYNQSPYKNLLMHGFFVDEKGEKMSKSVGNFVPLEEIIAKYGADSFRLWGTSSTIWEELKFNWNELKEASADLNILYNMYVFLDRFYPEHKIEKPVFLAEDKWLISKTNKVCSEFSKSFEDYDLSRGVKLLRSFMVEDISRWYMKVAKDRISRSENSEGALYAIYYAVFNSLKLFGLVTPFLSESIYRKFFMKYEKYDSLFLSGDLAVSDEIDEGLEQKMNIIKNLCSAALMLRQEAGIKVRWPIRKLYLQAKTKDSSDAVKSFSEIVKRLSNVKEVIITDNKPEDKVVEKDIEDFKLYLQTDLDEELYEEGIANEIKRRIQIMRKEMQLIENDKISVEVSGENELEAIVAKNKEKISKEVNASSFKIFKSEGAKEFEIDGRRIFISIRK